MVGEFELLKRFFAHLTSESCDHYYIQFKAAKMPKTSEDWKPIFLEHLKHEMDYNDGPGVCGTWLYISHCEEILL